MRVPDPTVAAAPSDAHWFSRPSCALKVLLMEGIHENAVLVFGDAGFENVILTPHVGGSTEEAQHSIGLEVVEKLVRFNDNGSTLSAVNFPQVTLPPTSAPTDFCTSTATSPASWRR